MLTRLKIKNKVIGKNTLIVNATALQEVKQLEMKLKKDSVSAVRQLEKQIAIIKASEKSDMEKREEIIEVTSLFLDKNIIPLDELSRLVLAVVKPSLIDKRNREMTVLRILRDEYDAQSIITLEQYIHILHELQSTHKEGYIYCIHSNHGSIARKISKHIEVKEFIEPVIRKILGRKIAESMDKNIHQIHLGTIIVDLKIFEDYSNTIKDMLRNLKYALIQMLVGVEEYLLHLEVSLNAMIVNKKSVYAQDIKVETITV